jgi:hypothetical protein
MKQYRVTWGDETAVVTASDEAEAWANFAQGNKLALSHPKLNQRVVEEVTPEPETEFTPADES